MVKVAIHGLGRVGRCILRRCLQDTAIHVVAVNDLNPDVANLAYALNYDSVHGSPGQRFEARDSSLWIGGQRIPVLSEPDVSRPDWVGQFNVDVLVDASGAADNVSRLQALVKHAGLPRAFLTWLAPESDFVLTIGSNHRDLRPHQHRVISCNSCDATAIAPVLSALEDHIGLESVSVAILHPWLNHQNLLDGRPPEGESMHFELGRAAHDNIIPKRTSAEPALRRVLPRLAGIPLCALSYRVPTPIVACADLSLTFRRDTSRAEILSALELFRGGHPWNLISINREPLVSSDFRGAESAAVLEERLLSVSGKRLARLTLWYDNEWGYAGRVIDQIGLCAPPEVNQGLPRADLAFVFDSEAL